MYNFNSKGQLEPSYLRFEADVNPDTNKPNQKAFKCVAAYGSIITDVERFRYDNNKNFQVGDLILEEVMCPYRRESSQKNDDEGQEVVPKLSLRCGQNGHVISHNLTAVKGLEMYNDKFIAVGNTNHKLDTITNLVDKNMFVQGFKALAQGQEQYMKKGWVCEKVIEKGKTMKQVKKQKVISDIHNQGFLFVVNPFYNKIKLMLIVETPSKEYPSFISTIELFFFDAPQLLEAQLDEALVMLKRRFKQDEQFRENLDKIKSKAAPLPAYKIDD